jgi:hypothetical protein
LAMDEVAGETARLLSTADETCTVPVVVVTPSNAAVIWVEPAELLVAKPLLLIVAVCGLVEVQTTSLERSCVVPSEKVPMAVNCCEDPLAKVGDEGVIAMETSVAGVMVMVGVVALSPSKETVTVAVPVLAPVASPVDVTVITFAFEVR